jgi:5-methylcytosine-specific restriction endonuclease McrA
MPSREERAQRRAKAFGYEGEGFTLEEWESLLERYGRACVACGVDEDLSVDHIVPLSLGGSNAITNIQPLCVPCNLVKGATVRDYRPYVLCGRRSSA